MTLLNQHTTWEAALEQLTALPGTLQEQWGASNFMRAGTYRRNGRRLYDEAIVPLMAAGLELEVVLGYVDPAIAEQEGISEKHGFTSANGEFLAARLRVAGSGETIDVSILAA